MVSGAAALRGGCDRYAEGLGAAAAVTLRGPQGAGAGSPRGEEPLGPPGRPPAPPGAAASPPGGGSGGAAGSGSSPRFLPRGEARTGGPGSGHGAAAGSPCLFNYYFILEQGKPFS